MAAGMTQNDLGKPIERRICEIHIGAARQKALRIVAFTGSVFPGEWTSAFAEDLTLDVIEFAYHARRVNQICGFEQEDFPPITNNQVQISENDPGSWVEKYQWALNRLVHMDSYVLGHGHVDHRRVYLASESNLAPVYVRVSSDKFASETISLYGLVSCFLVSVIPLVMSRFPDFRF